jgi:hypothetical protein
MKKRDFSYVGLFFVLVFIISIFVVLYFINKMFTVQLSNIESGIFAISLSAATTSFSLIASIIIANLTLESELKTYGKLATRRIIQSIKSCKAILQSLCAKKVGVEKNGFSNKEVAAEFFDNMIGQVNRLMSTIFDSREDWKDILKEESKQVDELDIELGETIVKYTDNQKQLEEAKKTLEETQGDKSKIEGKIKELEKILRTTEEELAAKKKKIESMSSTWPSGATLNVLGSVSAVDWIPPGYIAGAYKALGSCAECGIATDTGCSLCYQPLCPSCASRNLLQFGQAPYSLNMNSPICKECRQKHIS